MEWYYPKCVGIKNIDDIGAWVCAGCRRLPKTVHCLKLQMATLLDNTQKMVTCIRELSERMENKLENLNDRLTAISNKKKHEQQSSTDALSLINNELSSLNSELQSKTGSILSKTQSIFDKVKTPSNLASVTNNQKCDQSKNKPKTRVHVTHRANMQVLSMTRSWS